MSLFRGSKNATALTGSTVATPADIAEALENAIAARNAAEAAKAVTVANVQKLNETYLGAKSSDPSVDNNGDPLTDGAFYYNTDSQITRVYDESADTWLNLTFTSDEINNINIISSIVGEIETVADIDFDVSTVAGASSDVSTVANNVTDVTNFADVYIGPAEFDPTTRSDGSSLQTGDLHFNTNDSFLKVYDGTKWNIGTVSIDQKVNTDSDVNFNSVTANQIDCGSI